MNLQEAISILRRHSGDWHEHAAASMYLTSYYNSPEYRHKLKPLTTDAAPPRRATPKRLTADQRREARALLDQVFPKRRLTGDALVRDAVARDEAWSRRTLADINRRNREFWKR
jgi:hypothetical protein